MVSERVLDLTGENEARKRTIAIGSFMMMLMLMYLFLAENSFFENVSDVVKMTVVDTKSEQGYRCV
jgi:hypothetical protein